MGNILELRLKIVKIKSQRFIADHVVSNKTQHTDGKINEKEAKEEGEDYERRKN